MFKRSWVRSQQRILNLNGHFSHKSVVKIVFERLKINEKEGGNGPSKNKKPKFLSFILNDLAPFSRWNEDVIKMNFGRGGNWN